MASALSDIECAVRACIGAAPGPEKTAAYSKLSAIVSSCPDGEKILRLILQPKPAPEAPVSPSQQRKPPEPNARTGWVDEMGGEPEIRPLRKPRVLGSLSGGDDEHRFSAPRMDQWSVWMREDG